MKSLLLAGGLMAAALSGATAETYRASNYNTDNEASSQVMKWFAEEIAKATNGEIAFEVFTGGSLLPAKTSLQGIGDGVAQMGFQISVLTPSDLPLTNSISGYGFVLPIPTAIGAAYADWVMHDPAANAEFTSHNVIPVGGFSTPTYPIICNTSKPVTELEQLKGLKIRFPGGLITKLAKDLGAVPVTMPAPEIYQALQTGQIDCAGILAAFLNLDSTLDEVSKSVTLLGWSPAFYSPIQIYNADFWKGLTTEQRAAIIKLVARAHAKLQVRLNSDNQKALDTTRGKGHPIVEPGESIKKAVADWIAAGVGDMASVAKDTYGVQDPQALFASFDPYVKKWENLIANVKDQASEEELYALFAEHLYKDIDPATYGIK